jgi:histidine ammonia-lyase
VDWRAKYCHRAACCARPECQFGQAQTGACDTMLGLRMSSPVPFRLGEETLTLERLQEIARARRPVTVGDQARRRMERSRAEVEKIAAGGDEAPSVYGVNTGFGALAEVRIGAESIRELQRNLVRSHAAGVGEPLPAEVVRGMLLLRAAVLATGHAGVRPVLCDRLCAFLDRGVHPRIPWQGSVGASGDLAPLAHLALVVMGEGEAEVDGQILCGADALHRVGLEPLVLEAKEGISLVNGTQLMTAAGALAVADALTLVHVADVTGVMSLETIKGSRRPFDPRIAAARPHPGAVAAAAALMRLTEHSKIVESHRDCHRVQDAYSFRCMPQVHGAARDGLAFARAVLETEMNASTDNPLVFVDGEDADILSGGNFHGQPVALALDLAAMAAAELGSIAERRIEQCVNPALSGLPPFLAVSSGLHSGFMLAQVTAAALASENKILCHPASVDTIPSSAGREDHVSMGAHGAWKLRRVIDNVRRILAIEALCAARGLDLRAPLRPGPGVAAAHALIRSLVPPLEGDRPLYPDIAVAEDLISSGRLLAAVQEALG